MVVLAVLQVCWLRPKENNGFNCEWKSKPWQIIGWRWCPNAWTSSIQGPSISAFFRPPFSIQIQISKYIHFKNIKILQRFFKVMNQFLGISTMFCDIFQDFWGFLGDFWGFLANCRKYLGIFNNFPRQFEDFWRFFRDF